MNSKIFIFLIITMIALAACFLQVPSAFARWYENGTMICGAEGEVDDVRVVADGTGGAILVWADNRSGTAWQVYAQRVDNLGGQLWGTDGMAVSPASLAQTAPDVVADGAGGAFIVWNDNRNGNTDIYGQYLDGGGTAQWPPAGLPICTDTDYQTWCRAEADGFGGLVVVWHDERHGLGDIHAQRINASGNPLWPADGMAVAGTGGSQHQPVLTVIPGADEASTNVLVAWTDGRNIGFNGYDIYMQRLTLDGTMQWGAYGVGTLPGVFDDFDQFPRGIEPSISGGFILSWIDTRDGPLISDRASGVHRFTQSGNVVGTLGLHAGYDPHFIVEPDGGYVMALTDLTSAPSTYSAGFKKDESGITLWSELLNVQSLESILGGTDVASDGSGGGVFCYYKWDGTQQQIFVQRIPGYGGGVYWGSTGVPICTYPGRQSELQIVGLGDQNALVVWKDERYAPHFPGDLFAQRVDIGAGTWGEPLPIILAVEDEPDDEGGWVRLRTRGSDHDALQSTGYPILGYGVWRRIETAKGIGEAIATGPVCETLEDFEALVGAGESTVGIRPGPRLADELGMKSYEWESLGFHAAMHYKEYLFVVPTRTDSTSAGIPWEHYRVYVHTSDGSGAWGSNIASGYSVDNLAPGVLTGLTGHADWDPAGLDLTWLPSQAGDLAHYVVHRGLDDSFVPDGTNRLGTTTQPSHFDGGWHSDEGYRYKVAAVDRHGNVGPFAMLEPGDVSATETPRVAGLPRLMQNSPNPFNPSTIIAFDLPERTAVALSIYDVSGRLVDVLLDEALAPQGRNEVVWRGRDMAGRVVPAGIYFYRLETGAFSETKRMMLVK